MLVVGEVVGELVAEVVEAVLVVGEVVGAVLVIGEVVGAVLMLPVVHCWCHWLWVVRSASISECWSCFK